MKKTAFLFLIFFSADVMAIAGPTWRPERDFSGMQIRSNSKTNYKDWIGAFGVLGVVISFKGLCDVTEYKRFRTKNAVNAQAVQEINDQCAKNYKLCTCMLLGSLGLTFYGFQR